MEKLLESLLKKIDEIHTTAYESREKSLEAMIGCSALRKEIMKFQEKELREKLANANQA